MNTATSPRATHQEAYRDQVVSNNAARQGAISATQHPRQLKRAATVAGNAAAAAARASAVGRPVLNANQRQPYHVNSGLSPSTLTPSSPPGRIEMPARPDLTRSPSTSNIAAVIATSRHNPPLPRPQSVVMSRPVGNLARSSTSAETQQEMPSPGAVEDVKKWLSTLNSTSTHSTGSKYPPAAVTVISSPMENAAILSPKPVRTITPIASLDPPSKSMAASVDIAPLSPPIISPLKTKPPLPQPRLHHANTLPANSLPTTTKPLLRPSSVKKYDLPSPPPRPVPTSRSPKPQSTLQVIKRSTSVADTPMHTQFPTSAPRNPEKPRSKNTSPQRPQTHVTNPDALATAMIASSLASWRAPSPPKSTPPPLSRRITEKQSHHHHHHSAFLSHFKPHPSTSRTPSPHKRNPSNTNYTNTPSTNGTPTSAHALNPPSVLRQTMRKEPKKGQDESLTTFSPSSASSSPYPKTYASDPDDHLHPLHHHKRGRARTALGLRKHPHKHQEGDRKRWRDAVAEPARRRYEGLWAANRGVFVADGPGSEFVSALVVRELWMRSRLPPALLAEVWALVEKGGAGAGAGAAAPSTAPNATPGSAPAPPPPPGSTGAGKLARDEFVVGLWLIDQALRGRKLPIRVGDTLWRSVRGVYGLTVPGFK